MFEIGNKKEEKIDDGDLNIVSLSKNSSKPMTSSTHYRIKNTKININSDKSLKTTSIDLERVRNNNTNISSLNSGSPERLKDFLMRKTEANFIKNVLSPIKSTQKIPFNKNSLSLNNFIKTDILEVEGMIKKFSDILTYYKIPVRGSSKSNSSLNFNQQPDSYQEDIIKLKTLSSETKKFSNIFTNAPQFQKKFLDLEKNLSINISTYFDKITENSQNLEYLLKDFNCKNKEELICRLSFEIYFNNLFLNKVNDLVFLFNLKYFYYEELNMLNMENKNPGNNIRSISDMDIFNKLNAATTFSKFNEIKFLIEKSEEKIKNNSSNFGERFSESNEIFLKNSESQSSQLLITRQESSRTYTEEKHHFNNSNPLNIFSKILEFNTITDILKFETTNEIILHIKFLFSNYNDKAYQIFYSLVNLLTKSDNPYLSKLRKNDEVIDNFILMRKILEDVFQNLKNENLQFKERNEILEKENLKSKETLYQINNRNANKIIEKLQEENTKLLEKLEKFENSKKIDFNEELNYLKSKLYDIENKNVILTQEKNFLEKQISVLNTNKRKNSNYTTNTNINHSSRYFSQKEDPNEEYENLLREQFEVMKNTFSKKLSDTCEELNNLKSNYKKEITKLKDEVNLCRNIRELFSNQSTEIKKFLDVRVI
jgi:hypothetical protein